MTIQPRDDLALMAGYHSPQVDVPVRLNTNEAPEPPPDAFLEELRVALADVDWNRYPDRRAVALRDAIGGLHGVDRSRVFAANGSNEVLQTLCLTYGGPGRAVLVFEPTYALHSHIARVTGTAIVERERRPDFSLDPGDVERAVRESGAAITFLCSPNNPTARVDEPEVVAAALGASTGLVVVDEAYGQFAPRSHADDVTDDGRLVVVRTFSKTWSMAATRLGYCLAPAAVVDQLHEVVLPYHLDAVKQLAGRLAVGHVHEMERRVARLVDERDRLCARLASLPVETWPSGANFVLFRPRERDGRAIWEALLERGVLVRDCSSWPRLEGCLRVTIGTPGEDDAFLAALEEVLSVQGAGA